MHINRIDNFKIISKNQNFKGDSGTPVSDTIPQDTLPTPLETSKAYASPQITQTGYKEIETFDIPYIGQGKLYELQNGHKVILIPKPGRTIIYTSVGVGNLNEKGDKKQTSHLLEHLVASYCLRPKNKETADFLAETGAEKNAVTCDTDTAYYLIAPISTDEDSEKLVKIQSETIKNTNFSEQDVENEKKIITQELDSGGDFTSNILYANRLTLQNLFNLKDSDDTIAPRSEATIKNIKREDLINYYNAFYQPNNMVTTIVGAVNDNTIKTVAKYFNQMQNSSKTEAKNIYPKVPTDKLIQKTVRKDVTSLDKNADEAYIRLSFVGPQHNNPKQAMVLGALKEAFREKCSQYNKEQDKFLPFKITTSSISVNKNDPQIIEFYGNESNDYTEDSLKDIYTVLFDLTQNPISEEDLKIIKDKMKDISDFVEDNESLAVAKTDTAAISGNLDETKDTKYIDEITAEDIKNMAKKYFDFNKASLVVIHPQEKPKETDKTQNVSFKGNADQLDTKDIREYELPNNLRVIIDSRPGIAKSTINFKLDSTKSLYNNYEAVNFLFSSLVSEETKQTLKDKNISMDWTSKPEKLYCCMNGSADKTLEMLGYSAGILLNPNLSPEQFNKKKKSKMNFQNLLSEGNNAKTNIYQKIDEELHKEFPHSKSEGNLKDLQFEDVKALHQQILQNSQGTVFITIPKEKLSEVKDEIFETLMKVPALQPYSYSNVLDKCKPVPLEKTKVFIKKEENNSQIEVNKIFKLVESGNIKDRAGLMLLNTLLGGNDKGKLFKYLRNKEKITYGAYSGYDVDFETGTNSLIELSTSVSATNKDNLMTVINEYDKSINELISKPVSQKELNRAKNALKSELLGTLEISSDRNTLVSDWYNSYYGINYSQALFDAIDEMTPEYVQALAKHYLTQPYLMSVVGNKEAIENNQTYLKNLGDFVDCS